MINSTLSVQEALLYLQRPLHEMDQRRKDQALIVLNDYYARTWRTFPISAYSVDLQSALQTWENYASGMSSGSVRTAMIDCFQIIRRALDASLSTVNAYQDAFSIVVQLAPVPIDTESPEPPSLGSLLMAWVDWSGQMLDDVAKAAHMVEEVKANFVDPICDYLETTVFIPPVGSGGKDIVTTRTKQDALIDNPAQKSAFSAFGRADTSGGSIVELIKGLEAWGKVLEKYFRIVGYQHPRGRIYQAFINADAEKSLGLYGIPAGNGKSPSEALESLINFLIRTIVEQNNGIMSKFFITRHSTNDYTAYLWAEYHKMHTTARRGQGETPSAAVWDLMLEFITATQ